MVSHSELKDYLHAEIEEILKYKWLESERRNHDIGFETAAMEWSERYGDLFRDAYWCFRLAS